MLDDKLVRKQWRYKSTKKLMESKLKMYLWDELMVEVCAAVPLADENSDSRGQEEYKNDETNAG